MRSKTCTVKTKLEHTLENIAREEEEERGDEKETKAITSRYSPHVREFLASRTCREMQTDERFRSWTKKKSLVKEIDEAMACKKQIERILQRDGINGGEGVTFVDLCSGKGFLSIVLSFVFPNAKVEMIDVDERERRTREGDEKCEVSPRRRQVESVREDRGRSRERDVYMRDDMRSALVRRLVARRDSIVERRSEENERPSRALVLSPCCLPQRGDTTRLGFT